MRRSLIFVGTLVVALLVAAGAQAAVTVSVGDGRANTDGTATVPVTVTCPPGSFVLEAHLTLSQDDQAISGQAGLGRIRCNGRPQTFLVTVTPFQGSFHAGAAYASPFILVQFRGTGETESGGSASTITLTSG
jgi:hypothetical protein